MSTTLTKRGHRSETHLNKGHKVLVMAQIRNSEQTSEAPPRGCGTMEQDAVDYLDTVLEMRRTLRVRGVADNLHVFPILDGGMGYG